ncbi:A24 family peptidase [Arthrobacter sp. I2-34]|uniref:A24 family peptidase n=1 Tax=Arthrobacter hankyongi TaxID=2904801 RepID=A0ABS9L1R0_9MICC|nr:A24 family peptidase [Arthrobacter hankyongi]MCG2620610.1 A24 family peptidase [Arthrobacter hankyongi]
MIAQLERLWPADPLPFWALLAACLYLLAVGARLSWIDVRTHTLPDRIVFPAYGVAAALLAAAALAGGDAARLWGLLAGGAGLWAFYFTVRFIHPAGMGFGDVKLAGVLGMYLGYLDAGRLFWGTMAAFALGGLYGLTLVLLRRGNLKSAMPFGPFMLLGTVAALLPAS